MEYLLYYLEKGVKYDFLLNYLKFQIENETYINASELKKIIEGLEPKDEEKEEEGENNE